MVESGDGCRFYLLVGSIVRNTHVPKQSISILATLVELSAELLREQNNLNLVEYFKSPELQQSVVSYTFSLSIFSLGFMDIQQVVLSYR